MHSEKLTLATICGGAVQTKIDRALERVVENILDANTDPKKKRTITLKITMFPNEEDYQDIAVAADVSMQLAPEKRVSTEFFVDRDERTGGITIMEHAEGAIKGQLSFDDLKLPEQEEKVIDITRAQ